MIPASAQAARYSPFSVTLAWVQVSPDKYHSNGIGPSTPPGTNAEKIMSVLVAAEAWR